LTIQRIGLEGHAVWARTMPGAAVAADPAAARRCLRESMERSLPFVNATGC